jgi:hypothetical protein
MKAFNLLRKRKNLYFIRRDSPPTADSRKNLKILEILMVVSVFIFGGCATIDKAQSVERLSFSDEVLILRESDSTSPEGNQSEPHWSRGRLGLPAEVFSLHGLVRADHGPGGAYNFLGALKKFAVHNGAQFHLQSETDFPDITVVSVRAVFPGGVPDDGSRPMLRLVEGQVHYKGILVLDGSFLATFADATLHSIRGELLPQSILAERFSSIDFSALLPKDQVSRILRDHLKKPAMSVAIIAPQMKMVLDFAAQRAAYIAWHDGTQYKIDARSGEVYSASMFDRVPGWAAYKDAQITALSFEQDAPTELGWPLDTITASLSDFSQSLVDRKVISWVKLMTGSVPKDCQFRLTYGAGEETESLFPFPTLHPGDTFSAIETRVAPCFSQPFIVRPAAEDTEPQATRRALAYQNAYLYTMSAARNALWNRLTSLYAWIAPRSAYKLHVKVITPDAEGRIGCGGSYACYVYSTHTIRIVDSILFGLLTLHEYGHYVHHTYLHQNYFQNSCLQNAVSEGVADAMRESLIFTLRSGDVPSDARFLDQRFSTPTRGNVRAAIKAEGECTGNSYGDGRAISEILWAFINDRSCLFDEGLGSSAPCQPIRIIGDARSGEAPIEQWGREALTQSMLYSGQWASAEDPPSPFHFVQDMGHWFKVLSEVYGLIHPDEWERIRQVFLLHGVDIGPFQY